MKKTGDEDDFDDTNKLKIQLCNVKLNTLI